MKLKDPQETSVNLISILFDDDKKAVFLNELKPNIDRKHNPQVSGTNIDTL